MKYQSLLLCLLFACNKGPSPPLSPQEELATFQLVDGFSIELVASDPMIQDPIVISFDEDGRLWVVEMRGFMPDIDGNGEDSPVGRVSVLHDIDSDGLMDSATVFMDSLVLPRALAIVEGGVLVAEDAILWYFEDTNNDLRADTRTVVDPEYGNKGVVEHSANGLWRGMDNWYYNAKSKYRYRKVNDQWIKDETEFRGQWGICHDNLGRLYYNYNWSQLHTDLVPANYLSRNPNHHPTSGIDYSLSQDRRVFPIRSNTAINRGYVEGTLDKEGRIIEFASACAPLIYRGDLFGTELTENAFVCEPTGNLVKRNVIDKGGFFPVAKNAYDNREFLASTDERFRPVWLTLGPDGALYIADMYRGIVQHGPYMSPYLREVTLERKLDRPINLGRIWRIVPEGKPIKKTNQKLSSLSISELVNLLSHNNGWYRDLAQRILVERKDTMAIEPLKQEIKGNTNHLTRLHALWTLEGLSHFDHQLLLEALTDLHPAVQAAALRILDTQLSNDPHLLAEFEQVVKEQTEKLPELQLVLSTEALSYDVKENIYGNILDKYLDSQVHRDAVTSSLTDQEFKFLMTLLYNPSWQHRADGKEITLETLATAVANKGNSQELTSLLAFIENNPRGWKESSVLNGLSYNQVTSDFQAVRLDHIPAIFSEKGAQSELDQILSRVARLYTWPGKISVADNQNSTDFERDMQQVSRGRSLYLTICASCHGNDGQGMARFAPPLSNSEWVLGAPERLAKILLHGMEGPLEVNGKVYTTPEILPAMPAFATTPPEDLAAIMTYVRQAWGNAASPVEGGMVGGLRVRTQGKITPWTVEELSNGGTEDRIPK